MGSSLCGFRLDLGVAEEGGTPPPVFASFFWFPTHRNPGEPMTLREVRSATRGEPAVAHRDRRAACCATDCASVRLLCGHTCPLT
eukprot:6466666-Prymnesium_polylepis.1